MWRKILIVCCLVAVSFGIEAKTRKDVVGPRIKILPLAKNIAAGQNLEFNIFVSDRSGIRSVELFFREKGELRYKRLPMRRFQKSRIFKTMVKGVPSNGLEYFVKSTDRRGNSALQGNAVTPLFYDIVKPKPRIFASSSSFNKPIYLGGRLSQSSLEYNAFQQGSGGYRLFGGYLFGSMLGLEIGYSSNGEANGEDNNEAQSRYVTMSNSGIDLMGVANIRLNKNLSAFAKAGMFFWTSDLDLCFDAARTNCLTDTDSGSSFIYSFGARYRITKKLDLLADLSRYNMELEPDDVAGNLTTLNMGVSFVYSFQ